VFLLAATRRGNKLRAEEKEQSMQEEPEGKTTKQQQQQQQDQKKEEVEVPQDVAIQNLGREWGKISRSDRIAKLRQLL